MFIQFREQALQDLEQEIEMLEEEEMAPEETGLKFMDKARKARVEKEKKEATRLREVLMDSEGEIEVSDEEDEENPDRERVENGKREEEEPFLRKKY